MSDFSQHIASLPPEKLEQLLHMLRAEKEEVPRVPLQLLNRETDTFRASFAQQRLWFLDQLQSGTPYYNICRAFILNGPLHIGVLERSLNTLMRRHEALRTTFAMNNGELMQIITSSASLPLAAELLNGASHEDVLQRVTTEALLPFDLQHEPLIRATLLQLHTEEHVFILTMHHIISDGWSMGIFFRELSLLYQAYAAGQPSTLAPLPVQYVDYTHWQREWLQGERLEALRTYWKRQLQDMPERLALPTDRPRPTFQSFHGMLYTFTIPETLTNQVKALSRREGATLFMTLLTAFNVLLYHFSGQQDLIVGSSIANRTRAEIEGLIGFFVNTLVLRVPLDASISLRALLKKVQQIASDAYEHQDFPFEQLVELLHPKRSMSTSPLFQVLFEMQYAPDTLLTLPNVSVRPLEFEWGLATFDLTLTLVDTGPCLQGKLEYNTDLFDASTITRMAEHLQTLLSCTVEHPEWCILDLPRIADAHLPMHTLPSQVEETIASLPPGGTEHASSASNAPQSVLEQALATIWREILQCENVGLFENFFDLGGHSFLVLQVHSKLSEQLHLEVPIVDLFNYPTISALVEHLTSQQPPTNTTVLAGQDHASSRKAAMQRYQKTRSHL